MIRGLGSWIRNFVSSWVPESDSSWEIVGDSPEITPVPETTVVTELPALQTAAECRAHDFVPPLVLDEQVERDLLAITDLCDLGQFWFPALDFLYSDPSFDNSPVLPDIRLSRAVRAGISARQKLHGVVRYTVKSQRLTTRIANQWYVCLRGPQHPAGFITRDYAAYREAVCIASTGRFHPGGISHSFGTEAEALAYLAAAGVQWPRDL